MKPKINVYSSDSVSNEYIKINNCGMQKLNDRDYETDRPKGRSDFHLVFVSRGKGHITVKGEKITVTQKQAFVFYPDEPQIYSFQKEENSAVYWVHFTGFGCNALLDDLKNKYGNLLPLYNFTADIEQYFYRMCHVFRAKEPYFEEICNGLLLTILGFVGKSLQGGEGETQTYDFIEQIIGDMRVDPSREFCVKTLAKIHNVSPNRLIFLFKKSTGVSPVQYLIDLRIRKAKELLLFSNFTVSQIGELVGYGDYAYFSKLFKRHTGISPISYRKNRKE